LSNDCETIAEWLPTMAIVSGDERQTERYNYKDSKEQDLVDKVRLMRITGRKKEKNDPDNPTTNCAPASKMFG
jgi:hypothetical protein